MDRIHFNLPNRTNDLPFSDGVLVGNTLYLSGRIGFDPQTNKLPPDLDQEITFLLDGIRDVLAQQNMTMDDLVFVQIFCPDLTLFNPFNLRYRSYFNGKMPARAFLGSGPLLFNAHFEIQAIAVKR